LDDASSAPLHDPGAPARRLARAVVRPLGGRCPVSGREVGALPKLR